MSESDSKKFVGTLFKEWGDKWGLRGDPFLFEEMSHFLNKEPLPASASQLMALIEKAFYQLVGSQLHDPSPSLYVERYNHGGLSGGHVCGEFWREKVLPELHRRYLAVKYANSMKSPRMNDKPCRYENFPGGCRYGASCRFHHAKPVSSQTFAVPRMHPHYSDSVSMNGKNTPAFFAKSINSNASTMPLVSAPLPNAISSRRSSGASYTSSSSSHSACITPRSIFKNPSSDQQDLLNLITSGMNSCLINLNNHANDTIVHVPSVNGNLVRMSPASYMHNANDELSAKETTSSSGFNFSGSI